MKKFWEAVGKAAVKVAVYALGHPDQVAVLVKAVKR